MKRGERNISVLYLVLFVLLILNISYSSALTLHGSDKFAVAVDSTQKSLQDVLGSQLYYAGHTYAAPSASSVTMGKHDASQLQVSVKDGEMNLIDALKSTNKLCPNPSKPTTYGNTPNPGHNAMEIELSSGKIFQTAINDGDFCCIPLNCPAETDVNCGATNTSARGCGLGNCNVVGTKESCSSGQTCYNKACCTPTSCPAPSTINCGSSSTASRGCGLSCNVQGTKCSTGQSCVGGTCVSSTTCTSTGCPSSSTVSCGSGFSDNCGKFCGTGTKCASGEICSGGICVPGACTSTGCPSSSTVSCGMSLYDNCGKLCGTGTSCASGFTCSGSVCVQSCTPVASYWGTCDASCTGLCGAGVIGTKTCQGGTCGGSTSACSPGSTSSCTVNCGTTCPTGQTCSSGHCTTSTTCLSTGCPSGQHCNIANGICVADTCTPVASYWGTCDASCTGLCGAGVIGTKTCQGGTCGGSTSACSPGSTSSCTVNCGGCSSGQLCSSGHCVACSTSCPSSSGTSCGSSYYNGCGGYCGTGTYCSSGTCSGGSCVAPTCTPNCAGKTCGSDGCGGSCGPCGGTTYCSGGQCVQSCSTTCPSGSCGTSLYNGCGSYCGTGTSCPSGETCSGGSCLYTCTPSCSGKYCGSDGCGGSCGPGCGSGYTCSSGSCVPTSSGGSSGGGTSGGGTKVICTELYYTGILDKSTYMMDIEYAATHFSSEAVKGYQAWAIPVVHLMRDSPEAKKAIIPLVKDFLEEVAYRSGKSEKGNEAGKLFLDEGLPIFEKLGRYIDEPDWKSLFHQNKVTPNIFGEYSLFEYLIYNYKTMFQENSRNDLIARNYFTEEKAKDMLYNAEKKGNGSELEMVRALMKDLRNSVDEVESLIKNSN